jgi:tRNA(Ile)-lysidine synthase
VARRVRYEFLTRSAKEVNANRIATGHTLDDRIETVLLNIIRGAGIEGLKGIPYRRGIYVRPLLDTARADVTAYCVSEGLSPRLDTSNLASDHYTRNKIRLELLPHLERNYNIGVREAVRRLSEIAVRDADYLSRHALLALEAAMMDRADGAVILDARKLRTLHPALLRYVLRAALEEVRGTPANVPFEILEQICAAIETPPASPFGVTTPPPHCAVRVTQRRVAISLR